MNNEAPSKQSLIVWWVVWVAMMSGIFVIYFVLGASERPQTAGEADSSVWLVALTPFVISTAIRWLILPQMKNAQGAFSCFIIGLAMAEMSCILGVVVFPAHKVALFSLGVIGMIQFVPYFANQYVSRE